MWLLYFNCLLIKNLGTCNYYKVCDEKVYYENISTIIDIIIKQSLTKHYFMTQFKPHTFKWQGTHLGVLIEFFGSICDFL